MLVLARGRQEKIVIPKYGITIVVVEIKGDKVRLGFEAPDHVEIHREEVYDRITKNRERK